MADQAFRFEISGLTQNQYNAAVTFIETIDHTGVGNMLKEHTPVPGNQYIDHDTLGISMTGPNLSGFVTRLKQEVWARLGRFPDVEVAKVSDLTAIKDAWQTYGPDIANRPALKAAIVDIWKNGARCMSGADITQLRTWLKGKGVNSMQELKQWLNQS